MFFKFDIHPLLFPNIFMCRYQRHIINLNFFLPAISGMKKTINNFMPLIAAQKTQLFLLSR